MPSVEHLVVFVFNVEGPNHEKSITELELFELAIAGL